jgi:NADH-quinone oxidoreductase subunit G
MPEIVFDGRRVTVPPGTNLVDAGTRAGVPVPIFCYHPDLGAVGACRVCAVTVKQGDKSRTVMGCMTEAAEGMEVTTLDEHSVALRKWVLEWMMVNHPHDCPICDEGGECQLQDLTIAAGQGIRRVDLTKRTFQNQYLGEFIHHEMNRCITCYRCSRFYQEYAGGRDFSATGSRDRMYFGRFEDGPLESPFSGNLVEMCPTGVFTDKLFRFKSRVWDLEIAPSVCPHCSVGCNVLPGARHGELQRVRVRENPAVNGVFLCDRGQFGHSYVMDPARPRVIRMRGESSDWEGALALAGGALLEIARRHGPAGIALVTSARTSLEAHFALAGLAGGPLAGARVSHFDDPEREVRSMASLGALHAADVPPLEQSDIARCDALLVAGASLVDEAPLAALAVRQAARRGGKVFVLAPYERYLGDVATVVATHPASLAGELQAIGRRIASGDASPDGVTASIAQALRAAARPGILLGSDLLDGAAIAAGAAVARALKAAGRDPRLGYLFPGPNAFGAAAMSREPALAGIISGLESGAFKAAVIVESEISSWTPRARQALEKLELLVVFDYLAGPLVDKAHVFFPTTVPYESDGMFVNRAGRLQAFVQDRVPGLSAIQQIEGESFPREYRRAPREGDARMAWSALDALREQALGRPEARTLPELRDDLERSHPLWRPLRHAMAGGEGAPLDVAALTPASPAVPPFERGAGTSLFRIDRTLGSEALSRRSAAMQKMAGPPVALLAAADAGGLVGRGRVALDVGGQSVDVAAQVLTDAAPGAIIVPRDVEWPIGAPQGARVKVTISAAAEVTR